jgi:hypothetical protein
MIGVGTTALTTAPTTTPAALRYQERNKEEEHQCWNKKRAVSKTKAKQQ